MQIVIIGSGNIATVFAKLLLQAGNSIKQVFSRNIQNAVALANELNCTACNQWYQIIPNADVYIVAIADDALATIHENWQVKSGLVVHTAGAISMQVLQKTSADYGVLYPLQSLRKQKNTYPAIPLLVDANTNQNLEKLILLAQSISPQISRANDEERLNLHLAAVIVNNFTNYLFTLSQQFCTQKGVDFQLLHPLITETGNRCLGDSPENLQTGPAVRGDIKTIATHLKLLENFADLKDIYKIFSKKIGDTIQHKHNIIAGK